MINVKANPLTEEELKQLSELLASVEFEDDYTMTIQELHGFITGVICGPKIMLPHEWINELFFDMKDDNDKSIVPKMLSLIERIYNQTAQTIEDQKNLPKEHFPAHPENIAIGLDYEAISAWCTGFHDAITIEEEWTHLDAFMTFIAPIFIAIQPDDHEMIRELSANTTLAPKEYKDYMIEQINDSVHHLFAFIMSSKFVFGGIIPDELLETMAEVEGEQHREEVVLH